MYSLYLSDFLYEIWITSSSSSRFKHSIPLAVDDRHRPEERRRNELYRQYYEEIQRRYDTDRPVDCSVIVVNKAQKYVHCPCVKMVLLQLACLHEDRKIVRWSVFISYCSCVSPCFLALLLLKQL